MKRMLLMMMTWVSRMTPTMGMPRPLPDSESCSPRVTVCLSACCSACLSAWLSICASNAQASIHWVRRSCNFKSDEATKVLVGIKCNHELRKLQPGTRQHAALTYWQLCDCIPKSLYNNALQQDRRPHQKKRGMMSSLTLHQRI